MTVSPFRIDIPDAQIDDLKERLGRTRFPETVNGPGWDPGAELGYMRELVAHWRDGFDWRAQEAALNRFAQVRVEVEGIGLHAVHERSEREDAIPVVLLHGWPGSFWQMTKLIPLLTGEFHVVAPSLPGYGFSDAPREKGWTVARMAEAIHAMMGELGYERYLIHGGDFGAAVGDAIATAHPDAVLGLHLTEIPWGKKAYGITDPSEEEQAYLAASATELADERGYAMMQATKPLTLAYGLTDSPVGLAAWIVDKFHSWSDHDGDIETVYAKDDLLTNVSIYWFTGTIGSSVRGYYEEAHQDWGGGDAWADDGGEDAGWSGDAGKVTVPTGFAIFPGELDLPPRATYDRFYADIRSFRERERGGHFATFEAPDLVADDLRQFVAAIDVYAGTGVS